MHLEVFPAPFPWRCLLPPIAMLIAKQHKNIPVEMIFISMLKHGDVFGKKINVADFYLYVNKRGNYF